MKRFITQCFLCILFCSFLSPVYAGGWFDGSEEVITNKIEDVVGDDVRDAKNGLRGGTQLIGKGVGDSDNNDKIYYSEVDTTAESRAKTADYVRALVNYALAALGLVALIYILYHGFLTVTAAGNDDQTAKGWQGIKYGSFALAGIGLAWFVVSILVRLIQQAAV